MRGNVAVYPAAQRDEAQRAVGTDGLHHEAHLVRMRVQLKNGFCAVRFFAAQIQVIQRVAREGIARRRKLTDGAQSVVFKAAGAAGVGKSRDHFERLHVQNLP